MDWPRFRHEGLLHEITEGRIKGKPTRGRFVCLVFNGTFSTNRPLHRATEVWCRPGTSQISCN